MDPTTSPSFESRVRTLQIMCGALVGGLIIMSAVLGVLNAVVNPGPVFDVGFPLWVIGAVVLAASFVIIPNVINPVRKGIVRGIAQKKFEQLAPKQAAMYPDDESKLFIALQMSKILRFSILEAVGVLTAVLTFISSDPRGFAVVVIVIAFMINAFPGKNAIRHELDDLRQELETIRAEGDPGE